MRDVHQLLDSVLRKQDALISALHRLEDKLVATQAELAAKLNAVNDKLAKIGAETTALLTAIDALKQQVASAPVSPELQAAFDKVAAQAQVVDDLVPDAPPPA